MKLRLQRMLYQRLKYLEEGTEVCIVYNGEILETYPARIKTVFAIYLLDENGEAIIPKDSD